MATTLQSYFVYDLEVLLIAAIAMAEAMRDGSVALVILAGIVADIDEAVR